jgi:hypothetical protein
MSKCVFNYLSHNAPFSWLGQFGNVFSGRTRVGVVQRLSHDAYPVWDLSGSRSNGRIRPYLEFSNLSNTGYEEIPGVAMPGRSVTGGVELILAR